MKNDQGFYSIESTISDFQEVFTIERFKSVLMKVDYDFMIQSLAPVVYTAPKIRCTKDLIEAGAVEVVVVLRQIFPSISLKKLSLQIYKT